jgi:hypothetical protein
MLADRIGFTDMLRAAVFFPLPGTFAVTSRSSIKSMFQAVVSTMDIESIDLNKNGELVLMCKYTHYDDSRESITIAESGVTVRDVISVFRHGFTRDYMGYRHIDGDPLDYEDLFSG